MSFLYKGRSLNNWIVYKQTLKGCLGHCRNRYTWKFLINMDDFKKLILVFSFGWKTTRCVNNNYLLCIYLFTKIKPCKSYTPSNSTTSECMMFNKIHSHGIWVIYAIYFGLHWIIPWLYDSRTHATKQSVIAGDRNSTGLDADDWVPFNQIIKNPDEHP